MLAGVALISTVTVQWWQAGLGPLDSPRTMRLAIPGATLTALGLQTMLASFFGNILGLRRR
jgi:hypothetical protein